MPIVRLNDKGEFELLETDLDSWKTTFRRVLLNGPPLSGKTSGLLTFPALRHILVAPGEIGHSSIKEDDNTKLYYWEFDPGASGVQYARLWANLQKLTMQILGGQFGPVTTFGVDGLHKIYYTIMKALGYTSGTDPKEYVKYHEAFEGYLNPILSSKIPYVAMTVYDGQEAIEVGSKVTAVFPDLPGKQAKAIMGKFPVVFHTERRGDGGKERFVWQLRASGKIQGCGVHVPPDVGKLFPAELEVVYKDGQFLGGWQDVDKLVA